VKEKRHFKLDVVIHACNPRYSTGRGKKISSSKPVLDKVVRPCLENKGTEDVTQGQYFPRMCETLGSISSTTKKKKEKIFWKGK
jgi:hypothetical protein